MQELLTEFEKKKQNYSIGFGVVAALVGFLLSWLFYDRSQPILLFFNFNEEQSFEGIPIGILCLVIGAVLTLSYCIITYKALALERDDITEIERITLKGHKNLVARITVSLVITVIVCLVSLLAWLIVGVMFVNLSIVFPNALLITTLYAGWLGYSIVNWVVDLDIRRLTWLAIITFGLGLLGSFLLADDPEWWRNSLSYLGFDSGSNTLFGWSIITVGILMLSVWRDLINTLNILVEAGRIPRWRMNALAIGATLASLGMIGVGMFPVRVTPFSDFMHNVSVYVAGSMFIIGMVGIKWIVPNVFAAGFIRLGFIYTALCVVFFLLYQFTDLLNFVALEVLAFAIFTSWMYYFHEYTLLYIRQQDIADIEAAIEKANRPLWEQLATETAQTAKAA